MSTDQRSAAPRERRREDFERAERLRLLVEQMPAVLWSTDPDLRFTSWMGTGGGIRSPWKLETGPEIGMTLSDFFGTEEAVRPIAAHRRVLRGESLTYEGNWWDRTFQVHVEPLRDQTGNITGAVGVALDITERKKAEEGLRESEERYRLLFERNLAGVFRSTPEGRILDCNDACFRMFGCDSREEFLSREASSFYVDPADREEIVARVRKEGILTNIEVRLRRTDGTPVWALENLNLVGAENGGEAQVLVGTIVDISDRKRAEEQIVHQAYHDALTALPNRRLFADRLSLAVARAHRFHQLVAVLYLDLDHFKLINDTLGHTAGDRLLLVVAERLKACVREGDTVARLGGDEFGILLPEMASAEEAARIAQEALRSVDLPIRVDEQELFVTASLGLALYPSDGEDGETLSKNADAALYRAKELGRNNVQLCTADLNRRATERLTTENGLRLALERGELAVYYQPFYNVIDRQIVGTEALLRWQRPGRGLVGPEEFVAVAEESRLILSLGDWTLRAAGTDLKAWQEMGFPSLRLAVNLSMRQFQQPGLVQGIERTLAAIGLDPGSLEIEITESVAMEDPELTLAVLNDLRQLGIRIAMDDFGTGHSSLSYLKRLPIQKLKIDRSFIADLLGRPEDAAIVRAIIEMGHSLGLTVIAEGVENEEQLAYLAENACDEVQGYGLSEPVSRQAFERFLKGSSSVRSES